MYGIPTSVNAGVAAPAAVALGVAGHFIFLSVLIALVLAFIAMTYRRREDVGE